MIVNLLGQTVTGAPSSNTTSPAVVDVAHASFQKDVLDASLTRIVLLDFWAPWCGPCKALTPVLTKIAQESNGQVLLAKVNIDQNKPLAQMLRVQSIPTVYIFIKGKPVDAFSGNIPKADIEAILQRLYPLMGFSNDKAFDAFLTDGNKFYNEEHYKEALEFFEKALNLKPNDMSCLAAIAHCKLFLGQITEAKALSQKIDKNSLTNRHALALMAHLKLMDDIEKKVSLVSLDMLSLNDQDMKKHTQYTESVKYIVEGCFSEAIDGLLDLVQKKYNIEQTRALLVRLFDSLGSFHKLTLTGRKRLGALLFL